MNGLEWKGYWRDWMMRYRRCDTLKATHDSWIFFSLSSWFFLLSFFLPSFHRAIFKSWVCGLEMENHKKNPIDSDFTQGACDTISQWISMNEFFYAPSKMLLSCTALFFKLMNVISNEKKQKIITYYCVLVCLHRKNRRLAVFSMKKRCMKRVRQREKKINWKWVSQNRKP